MIRTAIVATGLNLAGVQELLRRVDRDIEVVDPGDADVLVVVHESGDPPLPRSEHQPPWVVLAEQPRREWLSAETGVHAILPLNTTAGELLAAIRAVSAGLLVMHPLTVRETVAEETALSILTPREVDVLRQLAEGLPNKIIAHQLAISEHTVKFHVAQILSKLQAGSRTEAVTAGLRLGIVHL